MGRISLSELQQNKIPEKDLIPRQKPASTAIKGRVSASELGAMVRVKSPMDKLAEVMGVTAKQRLDWKNKGKIRGTEAFFRSKGMSDLGTVADEFISLATFESPKSATIRQAKEGKSLSILEPFEIMDAMDNLRLDKYDELAKKSGLLLTAEELKQIDVDRVRNWSLRLLEESERGFSGGFFGGKTFEGLGDMTVFAVEFFATGGVANLFKAGVKPLARKITGELGEEAFSKIIQRSFREALNEGVKRTGYKSIITGAGAVGRTVSLPHRIAQKVGELELAGSIVQTEKGLQLAIDAKKKPMSTILIKGIADVFIENLSEDIGLTFLRPGLKAGVTVTKKAVVGLTPRVIKEGITSGGQRVFNKLSPVMQKIIPVPLASSLTRIYMKLHPEVPVNQVAAKLWTKVGFDGFIEEIGEEVVGDIMRAVLNVDDFGTQNPDVLVDRVLAAFPNSEELQVLIGTMIFPTAGRASTGLIIEQMQKMRLQKEFKETQPPLTDLSEKEINAILEKGGIEIPPKVEVEPEVKVEVEPEVKVEVEPEVKVEEKPEVKVEEKPEVKVEEKPKLTPEEKIIAEGRFEKLDKESQEIQDRLEVLDLQRQQKIDAGLSIKTIEAQIEKLESRFGQVEREIGAIQEGLRVTGREKIVTTAEKVLKAARQVSSRAKIATLQEVKQTQKSLESTFRGLKLTREERGEVSRIIKNIQTQEQLAKALPKLEARVKDIRERTAKRTLTTKIKSRISKTKAKRRAGKPVGKFTPDVQKALDRIRTATTKSIDEVNLEIESNIKKIESNAANSEDLILDNAMLQSAGALKEKTAAELQQLLNRIDLLIESGRTGFRSKIEKRKARKLEVIEKAKSSIGVEGVSETRKKSFFKEIKKATFTFGKRLSGWDDIMDIASSADIKTKAFESELSKITEVTFVEQAEKGGVFNNAQIMVNGMMDSFGFKKEKQARRQMRQDGKVEFIGEFVDTSGKKVRVELSKMEARDLWMKFLDPAIAESLESEQGGMLLGSIKIRGVTPQIQEAIFKGFLTTEDIKFAQSQIDFYNQYYDTINKKYRDDFGIDLPRNVNYSPVSRRISQESVTETFFQEMGYRRGLSVSALKTRQKNFEMIRVRPDVQVFQSHVTEMERYLKWSDKLKDINAIFGNAEIRELIIDKYGKGTLNIIDEFIVDFTRGGIVKSRGYEDWFNKIRKNFTVAALALKPSIAVKQLASIPAYAEFVEFKDLPAFSKNLVTFWKNPVANARILIDASDLLKTRQANIDRDLKDVAQSNEVKAFVKSKSISDMLLIFTKWGDSGAIIYGGWGVYKTTLDKTGSKKKAIEAFEKATASTQQSADISQLSTWQRGGAFAKLFTMFTSSQNQYFRRELSAWRGLLTGRLSKAEVARKIAIYHFILPMFFQWISDFGQWDEDEQERAMILGSLNGIFILGDILDSLVRKGINEFSDGDLKIFEFEATPIFGSAKDFIQEMNRIDFDDMGSDEILEAVFELSTDAAGPLTGVPVKRFRDIWSGVDDIIEEEPAKGTLKLLGWSPWLVDKKSRDSDFLEGLE